ncbi:hypothetical protein TL18_10130 [Methanobrevibacter sp. YE315]|uniref:hypothetical protein n=1 Tax=Methanobrevibacter sp. YE315 TaxID=1609968 RepID=UPI000764E48F|nr:hypothetical protein [Methanobrevibacter sp. YE315]AMD18334.1 hypothetical protein TL18_10130 [Methanobrevibacter sp. YE315]
MNMKRLLVLGVFLFAVVSMAAISAETTQEITLDGIHFKIPEGYTAVEKELDAANLTETEDIDGTAVDTEASSEYKNAAGDELEFKVGTRDNQKIDSINPANAEKKNIAGKDGFLIKESDDGKDKFEFEYLQDGKIVKITAVSEDIISQVIA